MRGQDNTGHDQEYRLWLVVALVFSAVILLLESTLIIGGRIIADYPIIGQNLWRHNICM